MIKSLYSLLACCAFMLAGTFANAQLSVVVEVNTDNFGFETYWSLTDELVACGPANEYVSGGNTVVGCAGCGGQVASAADPGAYGNNLSISSAAVSIPAGNYDLHAVDDWDDGTTTYNVYVDGVLQHSFAPGGCGLATLAIAAIVDGCTDPASCNYNVAANNDDGTCDGGPGSVCDFCTGGPDDGTGVLTNNPDPGDACDDADAGTTLDEIQADCSCAGQPVEIGCNDPLACNFNELSIADDGSCVYATGCDTCSGAVDGTGTVIDNPEDGEACDDGNAGTINDTTQPDCSCVGEPIVLGCTDPLACNWDPAANVDDASCCTANCVDLILFDTLSDGWDGATYDIIAEDGVTVLYSGTMSGGVASETVVLCLVDGCYSIVVGGGSFASEHSWDIPGANGGAGVSGIDPADQFFYIGAVAPPCAIIGCTDAGACNYDPLANVDDGSCDFSCVGCTDPDGCNWDILFTIDDGSCDYSCYGCLDPLACNFNTDPLVTIPSNGTYGEPCCLDNCLDFNMFDSFGDGWNGNTYTLVDAGGAVVATGDIDSADTIVFGGIGGGPVEGTDGLCVADGCYFLTVDGGAFQGEVSWEFNGQTGGAPVVDLLITVNAVAGCTNPLASNFDPLAACDDGTCSFCDPGQLTAQVNMADDFGDGWNGATYTITDLDTGVLVAFGSLDFAGTGDGSSNGFDIICLDPGCYEWNVGGGTFDPELIWDITLDDGTVLFSGTDAASGFGFSVGGAACDIGGCTDPICFNYNPYATTDDGSCVCPPANDLCDNAEAVVCGGSYFGSTSLASADLIDEFGVGVDCGGETVTGPGVWYQYDGDGQQVTAALCSSSYDTKMFVFSGSCAALDCVGANDDGCPVGLQSQFTFTTLADGTDYYIYVTGFGASTGDYTLDISCNDCTGVVIPNDDCDNAITQIPGIPFEGSLCCVNPDDATLCTPAFQTPYAVWFKMNSGLFDTFDFTLNNGTASSGFTDGGANVGLAIFVDDTGTGDCSALTELACCGPITGTCAGDLSAFLTLLPNTDYYFMVYTTDAGGCGGYTFVTDQDFIGCTDPLACNYDPLAGVLCTNDCCVYEDQVPVIASGFAPTTQPIAIDAGAEPCTDVTIIMSDSFGDGWNDATWEFFDTDGITSLGSGTLATGFSGIALIGCFPTGTYTLTVGGGTFDGEISWDIAAGEVVICVPDLPVNDLCADAIDLSCGVTETGSNGTATADAIDVCGSGAGAGVWYTFVGDGSLHNINTCGSDIDTHVDIFVSDTDDCLGVFSCATDFITGALLAEADDADVSGGCGFFEQDDVNLDFVDDGVSTYFVYVSSDGTGGAFTISHTCQAYTPGCTNASACNYDALATYDDGTCEWASCVCDTDCPGTGFGLQFAMTDSFGDGWNGASYTITNVTTGVVIQTGDIDNADDGGIDADNFAGNESGNDYFCICDAGCYEVFVADGDWPGEVGWELNTADGTVNLLAGVAPNATGTFGFSIGGAVCGCTTPAACNYDAGATVDDGSCEFDSCAGCTDPLACNYDAEATFDDGTYCCYDTCLGIVMTDSGFDGWEGGVWEVVDPATGTVLATGTLEDGGFGEATACLLDGGCYYLNVTGGSTAEIGWALIGADAVEGVATGTGSVSEFYFAVGSGICVSCQIEYACNYDPTALFDDCDLCVFDGCSGCTYLDADNYDVTAVNDDGTCEFTDCCPTDLDGDLSTGTGDLLIFLGAFGTPCPAPGSCVTP